MPWAAAGSTAVPAVQAAIVALLQGGRWGGAVRSGTQWAGQQRAGGAGPGTTGRPRLLLLASCAARTAPPRDRQLCPGPGPAPRSRKGQQGVAGGVGAHGAPGVAGHAGKAVDRQLRAGGWRVGEWVSGWVAEARGGGRASGEPAGMQGRASGASGMGGWVGQHASPADPGHTQHAPPPLPAGQCPAPPPAPACRPARRRRGRAPPWSPRPTPCTHRCWRHR